MSKKNMNHKRQEQESAALKQIFNTFLIGLAAECYYISSFLQFY